MYCCLIDVRPKSGLFIEVYNYSFETKLRHHNILPQLFVVDVVYMCIVPQELAAIQEPRLVEVEDIEGHLHMIEEDHHHKIEEALHPMIDGVRLLRSLLKMDLENKNIVIEVLVQSIDSSPPCFPLEPSQALLHLLGNFSFLKA